MADPNFNQNAFYQAQHDEIEALFQAQEDEGDWSALSRMCDEALSDPFLPRWHRAKYEAIRAWDAGVMAEEHIKRAKDVIEDIKLADTHPRCSMPKDATKKKSASA